MKDDDEDDLDGDTSMDKEDVEVDTSMDKDDTEKVSTTIQVTTSKATTTTIVKEDLSGETVIRIKEGDKVELKLKAKDPDNNQITYTFSSPLNSNGEWKTNVGDAGEYNVIVTASDGISSTSKNIRIIVEALNQVPRITNFDSIKEITVDEGETIIIDPDVIDTDGDDVEIRYSGFMTSNTYTTNFEDSGKHIVTLTMNDGKSKIVKEITVIVLNKNRAPELRSMNDFEIKEGEKASVTALVIDPDGDDTSITYGNPLNSNGDWQTDIGDAGEYKIVITASDGFLSDQEEFILTVMAKNNPPTILELDDITVDEGDNIIITPVVSDSDGDSVQITYSGWMTTSQYKTNFNDAGTHSVTISASDGKSTVTEDVKVIVNDKNRPPVDLEIEVIIVPGDE